MLKEYVPANKTPVNRKILPALVKAFFILGFKVKGRRYFWKLMLETLLKHPKSLGVALHISLYFIHFSKVFEETFGIHKQQEEILLCNEPILSINNSISSPEESHLLTSIPQQPGIVPVAINSPGNICSLSDA
jgi:hypothetical protein